MVKDMHVLPANNVRVCEFSPPKFLQCFFLVCEFNALSFRERYGSPGCRKKLASTIV